MLKFRQSDKKPSKDILRNKSTMIMHSDPNCISLLRSERSLLKRSEKLSTKQKDSRLNAILEIKSSLLKDSKLPNSRNNNKNTIIIERSKKFKSEERCLQDF